MIEIGSAYVYLQNQADDNQYYLWAAGFVILNLPTPTYTVNTFPPLTVKFFNFTSVGGITSRTYICQTNFPF
jgi:hypothetical protein